MVRLRSPQARFAKREKMGHPELKPVPSGGHPPSSGIKERPPAYLRSARGRRSARSRERTALRSSSTSEITQRNPIASYPLVVNSGGGTAIDLSGGFKEVLYAPPPTGNDSDRFWWSSKVWYGSPLLGDSHSQTFPKTSVAPLTLSGKAP